MLTYKHILFVTLLLLIIGGCQRRKKITLATNIEHSIWHTNGEVLAESMAKYGWDIEVLYGPQYGPEKNITLIKNKKVDFAIVANSNIHSEENINTVASLNTEVLLILHRSTEQNFNSLNEIVRNKKVLLPEKNSEPRRVISRVFKMLDIDEDSFTPLYMNTEEIELKTAFLPEFVNEVDVIIFFSELYNPQVELLLNSGWEIYSGGKVEDYLNGSLVDAFCYQYPWAYPFLVPRKIYGQGQPEKLNTIGIKSILVAHEKLNSMLVYDFLKDFNSALPIISKKRVAFAESRYLDQSGILSFPLHPGAVNYRDREKPNFAERYAELLALIVTLFAVGGGLITQYIRKLRQYKKDKIDHYYNKLFEAQNIEELNQVRLKAIRQLQQENLAANNSFLIFLSLYEDLKAELKENKSSA